MQNNLAKFNRELRIETYAGEIRYVTMRVTVRPLLNEVRVWESMY